MELQLRPGPDPRAPLQMDRMVKNLTAVTSSMLVGFFCLVLWFAASGASERVGAALVTSLACLPFTLVPAIMGVWGGYWLAFLLLWGAWRRFGVPRRARSVRWNGPQLHTDHGTVYVDEPEVEVDLPHGRFGTVLTVDDGNERLAIHGDHATIAPLANALVERVTHADTTEEEVAQASSLTRRVRERALE